jgi:DNA polymerase III subunit epsilon
VKKVLIFDTETTGMALWDKPVSDAGQPRMVQIAALLKDLETGKEISSISAIIKPDGFEISQEVSKIHGITTDYALDVGISARSAIQAFTDLAKSSDILCAHNLKFDSKITRIEMNRAGMEDQWLKDIPSFDTMLKSTGICKLPGKRGYKWPTLGEAYQFFFGKKLEGAHDAMVDVRACAGIYEALQRYAV